LQSSKQDPEHVKEYEKAKMVDEGGADHSSFEEAREEVRKTKTAPPQGSSQQAVEKGSETTEATGDLKKTVKQTTSEVSESAKGTSRKVEETVTGKTQEVKEDGESMVENVKETMQGLKDVGVEAAKAIKRDTEKVAEKVGIKSPN
jgi:methyl-accepting chemotaxis protein